MERDEALKFLIPVLLGAMLLPRGATAAVPPEIPQARTYEIFDAFEFAAPTGDNYGSTVVSAGGPSCLVYKEKFNFRLTTTPTTSTPPGNATLPGYLTILRQQAGLFYSVGHGNTSLFTVEAYVNSSAGRTAAINAANAYVAGGWGYSSEIIPVVTDDGYFGVAVTGAWIQRMLNIGRGLGLNPRHDLIVQLGCKTFTESLAFVNAQGLTRDYAGFTANVNISTTINPSYYNQVSSAIFSNMSGMRNDAIGSYGNASFVGTFGAANNVSPIPILLPFQTGFIADPNMPPNALQMRLYNAPRIVLSDVHQDTNLDGSYATQLYHYNPYSSYPYNPGGTSPYPGPAGQTALSSSSAPIKISLQFSEPMDTGWSNFLIQLQFSDGSTQNVSGSWTTTYNTNDTWTGTASFSSGFAQGKITVAVRARKVICGSGLDTGVQELDTTGSGQSGASPSYDTSTSFTIDTIPPASGNKDPNRNPLPTVVSSTYCVVIDGTAPSGIKSISMTGPSFSDTETFSCFPGNITTHALSGPFCQLAAGDYTITVTNCANKSTITPQTITPGTIGLDLCASGSFAYQCGSTNANASDIQNGYLRISDLEDISEGCDTPTQTLRCAQFTLSTAGSPACFANGGAGQCSWGYKSNTPSAVNESFSVNNTSNQTATGMGMYFQADLCTTPSCQFPVAGAGIHVPASQFSLSPGGTVSGAVHVSQVKQPYPTPSPDNIVNSKPTIANITISSQSCSGILNYPAKDSERLSWPLIEVLRRNRETSGPSAGRDRGWDAKFGFRVVLTIYII